MRRLFAHKYWTETYGKTFGVFIGSAPVLVTSDPDMLKSVLVKDFAAFHNRPDLMTSSESFSQTLVSLRDEAWKHVRVQMSPAFSTAKLRQMTSDMNACAALLIDNLMKEVDNKAGISVIQFTGAFTLDVIARTVFGLQINSQVESNSPFVLHAKKAFQSLKNPNPAFVLGIIFPFLRSVYYWLNMTSVDKSSEEFFGKVIEEAMRMRAEEHSERVDFLQQMLKCKKDAETQEAATAALKEEGKTGQEATKKQTKKGLTHMQILANSILFFVAAYDTTTTTLMFILYNLTLHPACQDRVAEEVVRVMGEEDEVKYDMLGKMTYLDKCIQETLRMYPPAISISREAGRDVTVNGLVVHKKTMVFIPIYALHHNPVVWPEPDKFDPERFSPEAKAARNPFTYLPFGVGPHGCIGMRLAQQEMKIMIAAVLRRFRFVPCPQTPLSHSRLQRTEFQSIELSLVMLQPVSHDRTVTFKNSIMLSPEQDVMLVVERR